MSRVAVAYVACALIWGTTWFAIRVCIGAGGYPTFDALALRFGIASLVLIPLALRARPWPRGRTWRYLALAGVLDALGYSLVYFGEARVSGGVAAVLYGTQPLVLAGFFIVTGQERSTRRAIVGALISLVGVAVLSWDQFQVSAGQVVGIALVLASVVVSTAYSLVMKRHAGGVHGLVATTIFLTITALVLGAAALAVGEPLPWPPPIAPTAALVYLAVVGSVVAFLAYFWMLARISLVVTSTLVFVFPIVALITDALFEHAARVGGAGYVGIAITLAGLVVSLRRGVSS